MVVVAVVPKPYITEGGSWSLQCWTGCIPCGSEKLPMVTVNRRSAHSWKKGFPGCQRRWHEPFHSCRGIETGRVLEGTDVVPMVGCHLSCTLLISAQKHWRQPKALFACSLETVVDFKSGHGLHVRVYGKQNQVSTFRIEMGVPTPSLVWTS